MSATRSEKVRKMLEKFNLKKRFPMLAKLGKSLPRKRAKKAKP